MWIRLLPEQFGLRTLARRPFWINRPWGVAPNDRSGGSHGGAVFGLVGGTRKWLINR
jgi:hypothetical protein